MAKRLDIVEKVRVNTEDEAKAFIEQRKQESFDGEYEVTVYSSKYKTKKAKGEIVDEGYEVIVTKHFNDFWEA